MSSDVPSLCQGMKMIRIFSLEDLSARYEVTIPLKPPTAYILGELWQRLQVYLYTESSALAKKMIISFFLIGVMASHALNKTVNYDAEVWSTPNKGKYRIYDY